MSKCVECTHQGEWGEQQPGGELFMKCQAPKPPTTEFISLAEAERDMPCDEFSLLSGTRYRVGAKGDQRKDLKAYGWLVDGVSFKKKERTREGFTYEVYSASHRGRALDFLRGLPAGAIPPLYYVVVETPTGSVGRDEDGLFDEKTGAPLH